MKKKNQLVVVTFAAVLIFIFGGCSNNQNPISPVDANSVGKVSMMSKYTSSPVTGLNKSGSVSSIDSIDITGARIVLKDVKLEGLEENHKNNIEDGNKEGFDKNDCTDEDNFKTGPFVLNLNLSGSLQQITVSDIPYGSYKKVKFKIHKINQSDLDSLPAIDQAQFADFLENGGYSIIIEGYMFSNGTQTPFTFKSSLNAGMEIEFSPELIVDANNPAPNLTLELSSDNWFKSDNGALLDPMDANNSEAIENNIKESFHVYKDCDRDGNKDRD